MTPCGEIIAAPLRGAWTGNRGCLHRDGTIVRPWASHHWLICALAFKDWWHEQWVPRRLTWLYFHDEAVALAAGHRPCALCRRPAYTAYRDLVNADGPTLGFDAMDRRLGAERLADGTRTRRLHAVEYDTLPDGAFVIDRGAPALVLGRQLVPWSPAGYATERHRRPRRATAELLTPPSSVGALAAGYPVQISAGGG